ncbi:MAG: beta-1,6-N-acetylglucosaminyltransferase [Flavobacteriales bacterium]|jgi:hypothetical protein|nr:beta-1,6-N-acetylglucosaminyltransferase [Flavobacteriales bacterium]
MVHAFLITAYKDVPRLVRLVRALGPEAHVYIHLDRRSRVPRADLDALLAEENVNALSRRYRVRWGSSAHLKAILHLARLAVEDGEAHYLHAISGSDHPLLAPAELDARMEARRGKEFLEHFALPTHHWRDGGLDRIELYHPLDWIDVKRGNNRLWTNRLARWQKALGIRRSTRGLPPLYGGSTWWSLSRECVAHLLDRLDREPRLLRRFAHTHCGEEVLVQTLVLDSPFAPNVVNDNLRYVDWRRRNGSTPAVLDLDDLHAVLGSGKLFARKLERPVSEPLLAELERRAGALA